MAELYDAVSPALYRYAFRLLGDGPAAEDVVGETFLRFLRSLRAGGGPKDHPRAYLFRVAHNAAMDIHRRGTTPQAKDRLLADPDHDDPDPTGEAESALAQAEARRALWLLTKEQQQVILLKYYEGWTNEEVAAALEKPVGAVKSLQHRALDSLRRALAPPTGLRETTP